MQQPRCQSVCLTFLLTLYVTWKCKTIAEDARSMFRTLRILEAHRLTRIPPQFAESNSMTLSR